MRINTSKHLGSKELEKPVKEFTSPFEFAFTIDQTVAEVLERLHRTKREKQVEYFYITDQQKRLQGILTIRDLLYSPPETKLIDIIDPDVIKMDEDELLEVAFKMLAAHELLALPVVDKNNRLLSKLKICVYLPTKKSGGQNEI